MMNLLMTKRFLIGFKRRELTRDFDVNILKVNSYKIKLIGKNKNKTEMEQY